MRVRYNLPRVDLALVRRIFDHFGGLLWEHRLRLGLSMLALLGGTGMALLRPWPLKVVFDYVLMPGARSRGNAVLAPLADLDPIVLLGLAAAAIVLLSIVQGVLTYSHSVLSKTVGHRLVADIRLRLFSHVQRLPLSYHDYRETGELVTRMTSDISLLEDLLVSTVINIGSQLLLVIGMVVVMFWLDWQLGLVVIGIMPFLLLAAFRFSVRIKKSARKQREAYGEIVVSVQESLAGISQVKAFAQEKRREKLLGKSADRDVRANVRTTRLTATYERVVDLITSVGTALVLLIGVRKAMLGHISPGDLLVFLSYMRGIYRPIRNLARQSSKVAKAAVRGEKIIELLEMQPEVAEDPHGISAKDVRGDFRFEHVDFTYAGGKQALRDFTCRIPAGKTTLLLGPTGAGKSTVAKLMLRLYDFQKGRIILDGRDITEYRIRSLRKRITPLTQETFLFRTTIAENIAFGRRHATREEIVEAARMVGADEFIRQLPDGYDTLVGEGGVTLSGGQRHRISFARAALRRSPVMIFDEPATGLDVQAEKEVKDLLTALQKGRTLLIITHRLHFLDMADWVVYMREGHVVEEGPPQELLARSGAFARFVARLRELGDPLSLVEEDIEMEAKRP